MSGALEAWTRRAARRPRLAARRLALVGAALRRHRGCLTAVGVQLRRVPGDLTVCSASRGMPAVHARARRARVGCCVLSAVIKPWCRGAGRACRGGGRPPSASLVVLGLVTIIAITISSAASSTSTSGGWVPLAARCRQLVAARAAGPDRPSRCRARAAAARLGRDPRHRRHASLCSLAASSASTSRDVRRFIAFFAFLGPCPCSRCSGSWVSSAGSSQRTATSHDRRRLRRGVRLPVHPGQTTPTVRSPLLSVVFAATAIGLNIVVGLAGLLDLGYIAFFGVGAYVGACCRRVGLHHDRTGTRRSSSWCSSAARSRLASACSSAPRRCGCAATTWRS